MRVNAETNVILYDKHQINSVSDVFCHPFYWRLREHLPEQPKLIIDCGANCGHTSMLFDLCIVDKYGSSDCEYVMIEANPYIVDSCKRNIAQSTLKDRSTIIQGLIGEKCGSDLLYIKPNESLTSSRSINKNSQAIRVSYVDLDEIKKGQTVDVLKVDIEGSEYDLAKHYPELLRRTKLLFIEIHGSDTEKIMDLKQRILDSGLSEVSAPTEYCGQQLAIYSRVQWASS